MRHYWLNLPSVFVRLIILRTLKKGGGEKAVGANSGDN
jgi:hypothetical protein